MEKNPWVTIFEAIPLELKALACAHPPVAPSIAVRESATEAWRLYCVCVVCAMTEEA